MRVYKFEAFTSDIVKNIRDGVYKPGHKLPSVRDLKKQYHTSISTIQNGYEHLIILGLVISIPKSGYYVATLSNPKKENILQNTPVVRDAIFEKNVELITSSRGRKKLIEFNVATPGDLIISQKLLLRTMQQIIREKGAGLLRYYPTNGSEDLKTNIIKHAAGYQTRINPQELLITDGALQALYIALSAVCDAGDVVAVESPCVFSILEVIRVLHLKVIEVPVDLMNGFDADFFKKACQKNKIKAVIITPNFHNPTGILLSDEVKRELVKVIQQHNVAVIENDIYGDLNFSGNRPSTLRSYDDSGLVMTYSSYAKTLAPGIRLGWLAAGKFLKQAEQIKFSMGSTVSPIYQETVNRLLDTNSYDRHIRAFRMQLAKNAHFTINLLSTHFPQGTFIVPPAGGYNIWVKMPDHVDMNNFYNQCERIGVKFTPGYIFSFSAMFASNFRIVFADKYSSLKIKALELMGEAVS
ncbi:aminotransferase-like domain-containing protein [Mucilaginibacter lappiensis]|uniref:DNA-binding transcriptional MocR family regulator n=1 Tax=Mucilaginibacter lappiensis TaxID=354630 RepID=A0A841JA83_9SPHI|nr:PLP-dependent aminotransferase family protein [Mucilaginibacter lappiensis]MBB6127594.1 DNA-binding transcriptional MocR family regulator [Mucilaginibacter lappiensis]